MPTFPCHWKKMGQILNDFAYILNRQSLETFRAFLEYFSFLKKIGLRPCKAEQPLRRMQLKEKEKQKAKR